MTATASTAPSEIYTRFLTTWDADTPAVTGGAIPEVRYEGLGESGPKPQGAPWALITVRHNGGGQATFRGNSGESREKIIGIVTVRVHVPAEETDPPKKARQLGEVAKRAFVGRRTLSNIWFTEVRLNELGTLDAWYQALVTAEFEYDEIVDIT